MSCGRTLASPNHRRSPRTGWGILAMLSAGLFAGLSCSRSARMEAQLLADARKLGVPAAVTRFPPPEAMPGQGVFRQADWFKLVWLQRRILAWEQRDRERGAIVFLGDSIFQGWTNLSASFPGLPVANHGLAGDTTRGALYRLGPDVLELRPRALVLLCGINDLCEGDAPESVLANIRLMLRQCQERDARLPVILCQVLPTGDSPPGINAKVQRLNQLLDGLAEASGTVRVAPTWAALADAQGRARTQDFPDLLHPNASGYAKLAGVLRPLLRELPAAPPGAGGPAQAGFAFARANRARPHSMIGAE